MGETRPNQQYFHFMCSNGGNRYFFVDWVKERVIQIVLSPGKAKKGRPHQVGITTLAMSSFRGTYYWYLGREKQLHSETRLKVTTRNQYLFALRAILDKLTTNTIT
jgi:hypothetical protein